MSEQSTESIILELRMRVGELEAELDRAYSDLERWECIAKENSIPSIYDIDYEGSI